MANIAAQRIKREFKEVIRSEEVAKCAIKVELVGDSYTELRGEIGGPPDTPYEGGRFVLEIKIPETYPFNPPKALMASPEPDDPQDAVVAKQYKENQDMFRVTARYWTSLYAGGPPADEECTKKMQRLKDMGVESSKAVTALSSYDWDLERATELLFS